MDILIDSKQMKQCDKNTIEHFGVPSLVLMERAALAVTEEIEICFGNASKQKAHKMTGEWKAKRH